MNGAPGSSNDARRITAIAAVLLFVSLGLRLVGIGQGLPHRGEPDTYIVSQAEQMLNAGLTDRYRAGWKYPHLVATVVAAVPAGAVERPADGATIEEHRAAATRLHLRTRIVAAVLSALAAPATFLVALRFLPLGWSVLTGLLVASSLLHICFSVQARPHGPVSAFAAIALLAALRWAERPTLGRALALGAATACAVGSLHTGFAVLAPAAVALVTVWRRSKGARGSLVLGALAALALVATSTAWFYVRAADGHGNDPKMSAAAIAERNGGLGSEELNEKARIGRTVETEYEGRRVFQFSGHVVPLDLFDGRGFAVAWRTLLRYDPLILLFGLAGIGAMLALGRAGLRHPDSWIVLAFALPTLLLYGLYAKSTDRFLLILVPMICLAATQGLRFASTRIPRVGFALSTLVTLAVVAGAVQTARLRARPDTTLEAAQWIEDNVAREQSIHLTNLRSLPLFTRTAAIPKTFAWANGPWEAYQWALLHPKFGGIRGEHDPPKQPTPDGPNRLGRELVYATPADQYRMVLGENRVEAARAILAAASPRHAMVGVNPTHSAGPVPREVLAAAWRAPLARDAWSLEHSIESGLPDDKEALEYRLDFLSVFRVRAFGPTIEVYSRTTE